MLHIYLHIYIFKKKHQIHYPSDAIGGVATRTATLCYHTQTEAEISSNTATLLLPKHRGHHPMDMLLRGGSMSHPLTSVPEASNSAWKENPATSAIPPSQNTLDEFSWKASGLISSLSFNIFSIVYLRRL